MNQYKILKFQAEWCGPCKALSAMLNNIQNKPPIEEIDIDKDHDSVLKYNIKGVPTLVLLDPNGAEVKRIVGNKSRNNIIDFMESI